MSDCTVGGEGKMRVEVHARYRLLPRVLRWYWAAMFLLTGLGFLATLVFTGWLHRTAYPYAYTLLPPEYDNGDFTCYAFRFAHFHELSFFTLPGQPFNYPAPVALLYALFYRFAAHPAARFVEVSGLCFVAAALLFARALTRRGTRPGTALSFSLSALMLSYPFMLEFYLSNMEVAVWACLAVGVWAYAKDRPWLAAGCFGLAASLKIYPIVYLALTLARRQYREACFGLAVCGASLGASLYLLGPTVGEAYRGLESGVNQFKVNYVFRFNPLESGIDHSLFGFLKQGLRVARRIDLLPRVAGPYLLVAAITGVALYFVWIRKLPAINQVLALTVASILFPPVSHDYTLIHLYAPWAMLILGLVEERREAAPGVVTMMLALFLILFSPENYLIVRGLRMGGPLKAVALMALFGLALRFPLWEMTGPRSYHADAI